VAEEQAPPIIRQARHRLTQARLQAIAADADVCVILEYEHFAETAIDRMARHIAMTLPDCPGLMLGAAGTQERDVCAKAKAMEEIRHRDRAMRLFLQRQAVDGIEKPRECIRTPAAVAIFAMRQFRDRLEFGDLIGWRELGLL
jgi:hypothetical protein